MDPNHWNTDDDTRYVITLREWRERFWIGVKLGSALGFMIGMIVALIILGIMGLL